MKRSYWIAGLLLVCAGLILFGSMVYRAIFAHGGGSAKVEESKSFAIAEVSELQVKTVAADVKVFAYEGNRIEAELKGNAAKSGDVTLWTEQQGGKLKLEVRQKHRLFFLFSRPSSLVLEVKVPKALIKEIAIETVSGEQNLSGLQATALASSSVSGDVALHDSVGKTSVTTVSGEQRLEGIRGESLSASSTSGNIEVSGSDYQAWSVHSVSGEVALEKVAGPVKAKTTSGNLTIEMARMDGISAGTVSGDIAVKVPQGAAFQVSGKTVSGSIRMDAAGFQAADTSKGHYTGGVGEGGPALELKTTSGDMEISN